MDLFPLRNWLFPFQNWLFPLGNGLFQVNSQKQEKPNSPKHPTSSLHSTTTFFCCTVFSASSQTSARNVGVVKAKSLFVCWRLPKGIAKSPRKLEELSWWAATLNINDSSPTGSNLLRVLQFFPAGQAGQSCFTTALNNCSPTLMKYLHILQYPLVKAAFRRNSGQKIWDLGAISRF